MAKVPSKKSKKKGGRKTSRSRSRKKKATASSEGDAGLAEKLGKEFAEDPKNSETFIQLWDIYLVDEA